MANIAYCILVKLMPSEPDFIALTTFEIGHSKSISGPQVACRRKRKFLQCHLRIVMRIIKCKVNES